MGNSKNNKNIEKSAGAAGKKKLIVILSAVIAAVVLIAALCVTLILLKNKGNGGDVSPGANGLTENGVYYSVGGKECELILKNDGTFSLVFDGSAATGSYKLEVWGAQGSTSSRVISRVR